MNIFDACVYETIISKIGDDVKVSYFDMCNDTLLISSNNTNVELYKFKKMFPGINILIFKDVISTNIQKLTNLIKKKCPHKKYIIF